MAETDVSDSLFSVSETHRFLRSSMLFKSILSLLGFYVFVSLLLPTVLIVCPGIVKHLVFLNICKETRLREKPYRITFSRSENRNEFL